MSRTMSPPVFGRSAVRAGRSVNRGEHLMPSATVGTPADFQTFLQPHRTEEVVETKFNGTIGNILLLSLAISMLVIGNYFCQNCCSSNEMRKTQEEHLSFVCQNLISL